MRRRGAVALLGLGLVLAGCSGSAAERSPVTVAVKAVGMGYAPKEIKVAVQQPVKLVLQNTDALEHDFSIDQIELTAEAGHSDSHGADHGDVDADVHVHAEAGKSSSVAFTPAKAGRYTYYCTIPGHKESGMVGTLTVEQN